MLSELCIPFIRVGGSFIAMKGASGHEEVAAAKKAIRVLGCELRNSSDVNLSDGSLRVNVEFVKVKSTPKQYPRAFAKIKKNPLRGE